MAFKKKAPPQHAVDACEALSQADLFTLRMSEEELKSAKLEFDLANARVTLLTQQELINKLQAQIALREAKDRSEQKQQEALNNLNTVRERSILVADELGARYDVDWNQAGYDPETGRITRLPKET